MKNKHIILILILTLLCNTSMFISFAEDNKQPQPVSTLFEHLLVKLGAIDETTDLSNEVTRAQYARILSVLSNANEYSDMQMFTDITAEEKKYINGVYEMGLMQGDGIGHFMPKNKIKYSEVIKPILKLMGYEKMAEFKGGYPSGYLMVAGDLKLFSGVDVSNMTFKNVIKILENASDADFMEMKSITQQNSSYAIVQNKTILSKYHQIYKHSGVVTSNFVTSIYSKEPKCQNNEIEIDKELFYYIGDEGFDYIGKRVNVYYQMKDTMDQGEVIAIENDDKNEIITFSAEDFLEIEDNSIKFFQNDKSQTESLANGYDYILNNLLVTDKTPRDFEIEYGSFTLIDNNRDNIFDLIIAVQIYTSPVVAIDPVQYNIYLDDTYLPKSEAVISIDVSDRHTFYRFFNIDKDGVVTKADIDEINIKSIASVIVSRDRKFVELYCTNIAKNGIITAIEEDYIYIDDIGYEYLNQMDMTFVMPGAKCRYYLDKYNRVALIDEQSLKEDFMYGYLYEAQMGRGLRNNLQVKLITSGGTNVYTCTNKFTLDGIRVTSQDKNLTDSVLFENGKTKRQLLKIKLNENDALTVIDTALDRNPESTDNTLKNYYGGPISKQYNGRMGSFNDELYIPKKAFTIVSPTNPNSAKTYESFQLSMKWNHEGRYTVEVFDVSENLDVGAVIVYDDSLIGANSVGSTDKPAVVKSVTKGLNNENEPAIKVDLYQLGVSKTLYLDVEKYNRDAIPDLEFGDIIRFAQDIKGNISYYEKELDISTNTINSTNRGNSYMLYGVLYSKGTDTFTMINRMNNADLDPTQRKVVPAKGNNYFIVNLQNKTVTKSNYASLPAGKYRNADSNYYVFTETEYYGSLTQVILYIQ